MEVPTIELPFDSTNVQKPTKQGEKITKRNSSNRSPQSKPKTCVDNSDKKETKTSPRRTGSHAPANNRDSSPKKKNRIYYEDHLPHRDVIQGLQQGTLVQGNIRINPHNRTEAYATCPGLAVDVFLNGENSRNRALESDLVAIKLDPEKQWRRRDGNVIQPTGKVVAIIEKQRRTKLVGCLRSCRDDNAVTSSDKFALFAPVDKRYPRMLIPIEQCPQTFVQDPTANNDLYIATLLKWTTTSSSPKGQLIRHLGKMGDFETEIESLLIQNDIPCEEFSNEVLSEVKQYDGQWAIPQSEVERRTDLRTRRIFSIDPKTCKDVDDALSIEQMEDNTFEIGVHIADVSYFVRPGTRVDEEAKSRATSVYLVNKVIPMLPRILSENVCSLNEGVDRLALSVFVKVNENGEVIDNTTRFEKTLIHNCAKMSYEVADEIIKGCIAQSTVQPVNGQSTAGLIQDILMLNQIASNMKQARTEKGYLDIINVETKFQFDEQGRPSSIVEKPQLTSCELVEEFMLLANSLAANALMSHSDSRIRESALLRNHRAPTQQRLNDFEKYCTDSAKISMNTENVSVLNKQLHTIYQENQNVGVILFNQVRRAMQHANYIRAPPAEDMYHYGLNTSCYTHFSSPIRRYADLLVHRLLSAAISSSNCFGYTPEQVDQIASRCNTRRLDAKRVQEQSNYSFLRALYSSSETKHVERAIISQVSQKNLTVYIPKISEEIRISFEDIQTLVAKKHYNRKDKSLTVTLLDETKMTFSAYDTIECEMYCRLDQDGQSEIAAKLKL